MIDKKITDLGTLTEIENTDKLLVGTSGDTYNVSFETLKNNAQEDMVPINYGASYAGKALIVGQNGFVSVATIPYPEPTGTITIVENGNVNVKDYAFANVSVVDDVKPIFNKTIAAITNSDVEYIGNYAFYGCSALTMASFPRATSLGTGAFYFCAALTTVSFPEVILISNHAFYYCRSLTMASFPKVTSIGIYAFYNCISLTTVSFPACISIGNDAFDDCQSLTTVSFPACISIGNDAFEGCWSLTTASFPVCASIKSYAFDNCYNLISLYLTGSSICVLSNSNAFRSTPIGGYSARAGQYGSIYVPSSLYSSYIIANNWSYFANRFVSI